MHGSIASRRFLSSIVAILGLTIAPPHVARSGEAREPSPQAVLVIHGGCGVIPRKEMTAALEAQHRADLTAALEAGYAVLEKPGGTSLDAVVAAIKVLEDSPLFNAGKGAVFTREGHNELDASIMDGRTHNAGAVASVTNIKNPITAARAVMENSGHVLMVGKGAEQFARDSKLTIVDPSYFRTQFRWDQYQAALRLEKEQEQRPPAKSEEGKQTGVSPRDGDALRRLRAAGINRFGTVGAVALDKAGNLAAGTSTGGLNMKRSGRVGDAPLIGAGNFADNESCAISSTGDGEYFIRAVAAYDISALVKYKGLSIAAASNDVIQRKIKNAGGDGAVIVLNRKGEAAMSFNTEGMYRGYISPNGKPHVFIYEP